MQTLYEQYKDKGLEIYGVPSNQFGGQEPKDAAAIKEFVAQYNVTFPLLEKVTVNGPGCMPVYKYMRENSKLNGGDISWNFAKFLVDGNGKVVKHYMPDHEPNAIVADFEPLLK